MSRRSFPRIDPASLRDHADEARVERVWDRVEHDLSRAADRFERRGRRSSLGYLAIAAALAAFGGGLWVGKATWGHKQLVSTTDAPMVEPAPEKSHVEVLAAGSQSRTFPLEGGARLTLQPGATVEVERGGGGVVVSLLQGEASIDNTIAPRSPLAVVAGDARLNTQAGNFTVTRNADDIDVKVEDGSVSVSAPGGASQQVGKHEKVKVPLRTLVSSAPQSVTPRRSPSGIPRRAKGDKAAAKSAASPDWLVHHMANDDDGALMLLRKQGVAEAINSAHGAQELFYIADILRRSGDDPTKVTLAYTRIVTDFPNAQYASLAAAQLAKIYETSHPDLAKKYREQSSTLAQNAPAGAEALFCNAILHEPDKDKAARMAKEYLADHPDADCRSTLEQLLAPADAPGPADPAPPAATP